MLALKGYYNGKEFISIEKANVKRYQKVIITVLDEFINNEEVGEKPYKKYVGVLSDESFKEIQEALYETLQ